MVETDLGGARAGGKGLEMRELGGPVLLGAPVVVRITKEAEGREVTGPSSCRALEAKLNSDDI